MLSFFLLSRYDLGFEYADVRTTTGALEEKKTPRGDTQETRTEGVVPAPE